MSRKVPPETMWNIMIGFMGLVVAALVVLLLVPKAPVTVDSSRLRAEEVKFQAQAEEARRNAETLRKQNEQYLWNTDTQRIGAGSLEQVTKLAKANNVKVVSFRPQRVEVVGDLQTVPFLATIEGSYMAVRAFESALEARSTRLAISQMQITSSNDANDTVTANIGLVAFRDTRQEISRNAKS